METHGFEQTGTDFFFVSRLGERNILKPTAIQEKVIPRLFSGEKLLFRSATGTGKTFAYLIPALQRLLADIESAKGRVSSGPAVLICAPTYELCSQIKAEIEFLIPQKLSVPACPCAGAVKLLTPALLIGSVNLSRQIDTLKKSRPLVAVGNPGRLLALAKMGKLKFRGLGFLVLDEADRLTADESIEETRELLKLIAAGLSGGALTAAACSATISGKTGELLAPLFDGAELVVSEDREILREQIEHWAIFSESRRKSQTLRSLLAAIKNGKAGFKALVFAGGNDDAGKILSQLQYHHIAAAGLFGKMDKQGRKDAIGYFRSGKINVLVASDLAARGLDIPGVTHVIALDVPAGGEAYIHRAGRTGRAGRRGVMISIGGEQEMRCLAGLEKKLGIMVKPKELRAGKISEPFLERQ
jgi:superfamily II DNA/RNA helicase